MRELGVPAPAEGRAPRDPAQHVRRVRFGVTRLAMVAAAPADAASQVLERVCGRAAPDRAGTRIRSEALHRILTIGPPARIARERVPHPAASLVASSS